MWKNRWRIVLKESDVSRPFLSLMIYATLVLHNICIAYKVAGYIPASTEAIHADNVIKEVMEKFPQDLCEKCRHKKKLHCRHKNRSNVQAEGKSKFMMRRRDEIADMLWEAYYHQNKQYPEHCAYESDSD